ncbi:MAG: hypothetical protein CMM74_07825 [Rhodospirillaceae bacterium]|nr:hypothetical protein [Rhodospirillaceae bacterium]
MSCLTGALLVGAETRALSGHQLADIGLSRARCECCVVTG